MPKGRNKISPPWRGERLVDAGNGEEQLLVDAEGTTGDFVPDLVICFPRPNEETSAGCCGASGPRELTESDVNNILHQTLVKWDPNTNRVRGASPESQKEEPAAHLDAPYEASCRLEGIMKRGDGVGMKDMQDAIIADLVNYLTLESCHTMAFKSCDGDDLFLCVSLGDPAQTAQKDVVVRKAAEADMMKVQTALDGDRADEKLGIKQTLKPGEEMYIQFDTAVIDTVIDIFQFPSLDQAGKQGRGASLIKQYDAGIGGTDGSVLRSIDRTRLLMTKIESFVDLEDLLDLGVISDYYIPHNMNKLEEFRSGKAQGKEFRSGSSKLERSFGRAHDPWSNFRFRTIFGALRWRAEDVQPIQEIRDYFGKRVAFYFVWLSFTARCVAAMVPLSFVLGVVYSFFRKKEEPKAIFYLLSALLICIGSQLYVKFWRRCEAYYAALWGTGSEVVSVARRPDYRGADAQDPLNERRKTRIYAPWKARAVHILALSITVVFIGMVICVVTLIYYLESVLPFEPYNKSVVSAIFSLQILIFQLVWDGITGLLVELANPRTEDDAKDLAVQFLFPFSFVSTYANIIYHGFYTGWGHQCLSENCMGPMRPSLYMVVLPALLMQVVSMLKPYALYRYRLNEELKQLRKSKHLPDDQSVDRSFLESQAKRPPFGTAELNLEMNIMMVLFGYFLMFGFIAPGISVAIALAFILKIRVDAFKLCSVYQRMMPSESGVSGIGEWNHVLRMLLLLGRFSASAIAIFNLEYFNLPPEEAWVSSLLHSHLEEGEKLSDRQIVFQKLVLAFAFKEVIDRICSLMDYCINDVSSDTKLMKAKRQRLAAKMTAEISARTVVKRAVGDAQFAQLSEDATEMIGKLQGSNDTLVPLLDEKHKDWTDEMDMEYVPPTEGGSGGDGGFFPDLVICFPRPQPDAEPGCCGAARTKYTKADVDAVFDEALVLRDRHASVQREESVSAYKMCNKLESSTDEAVSLIEIQNALISDMIEFLAKHGYYSMLFRSCDEDELFLCIALGNPRMTAQQDPAVREAAQQANMRVQTTLDRKRGDEKLKVLQEIGSSEEMYMFCDFDVITKLSEALDFTPPRDAASGDQILIKQYAAGIAGTEGSVLRTVDRVRLLMTKMAQFIDLEDAMGEGILSDFYTPHHTVKLREFSSGKARVEGSSADYQQPHGAWSTFRCGVLLFAPLRWKFDEVQPIQEIRDYFGERIAFYFAWLAITARAFVVAVPASIVFAILYTVFHPEGNDPDPHELEIEAILYVCASVLTCAGATVYRKCWSRWESYYAALWDTGVADSPDARRPDYRGDPQPDPLNTNKKTKMYPAWKATAVYLLAITITTIFIVIVAGTVTLIYWLDTILPFGKWNRSVISVLFSIQIVVFQLVWDAVSQQLVELANPRTEDQAKDLAVQFLFPFSFVSTYANIAYHAFYTRWDEPCVEDNCMKVMRPAMYQVVLPALVMQVISMLRPYAVYRWQLNDEKKKLRIKKGLAKDEKIYRSSLEAQAKRPPFGTMELNNEMNTMLILVGYGILFGFVAPGITFAVALAFVLKIRIDAFKLCSVYQRVRPAMSHVKGIGEWNDVLTGVLTIGRYTACAVPVFNLGYLNLHAEHSELVSLLGGPNADGLGLFAKIVCVFILKEFVDIICGVVEFVIDSESSPTKLMKAKRAKMAARLMANASNHTREHRQVEVDGAFQRRLTTHNESLRRSLGAEGGAAGVPKLDRSSPYWSTGMDVDFAPVFVGETYFGK